MTQSTTRIGLLSDVHATVRPVREALDIFHSEGVESILCAGDIAGYGTELEETVALLIASGCRAVLGNHDLWYFESCDGDAEGPVADYLRTLPTSINLERQETSLTMLHASPEDLLLGGIRLLDEAGDVVKKQEHRWCQELMDFPAEVLVVGHTHQAFARPLGETLVINPGSTLFNHTCAILTLPDKNVRFFPLSGKRPVWSWNFSMFNYYQL